MLNHITLMGRLVADPEFRTTPSGVSVATVRVACDRDFKHKPTGEKETDFITAVAWRQTGEFLSKYFAKGRMAVLDGRLQVRSYTDKDGVKRTATEIVAEHVYFGDSKKDGDSSSAYRGKSGVDVTADGFEELTGDDGDLPF